MSKLTSCEERELEEDKRREEKKEIYRSGDGYLDILMSHVSEDGPQLDDLDRLKRDWDAYTDGIHYDRLNKLHNIEGHLEVKRLNKEFMDPMGSIERAVEERKFDERLSRRQEFFDDEDDDVTYLPKVNLDPELESHSYTPAMPLVFGADGCLVGEFTVETYDPADYLPDISSSAYLELTQKTSLIREEGNSPLIRVDREGHHGLPADHLQYGGSDESAGEYPYTGRSGDEAYDILAEVYRLSKLPIKLPGEDED